MKRDWNYFISHVFWRKLIVFLTWLLIYLEKRVCSQHRLGNPCWLISIWLFNTFELISSEYFHRFSRFCNNDQSEVFSYTEKIKSIFSTTHGIQTTRLCNKILSVSYQFRNIIWNSDFLCLICKNIEITDQVSSFLASINGKTIWDSRVLFFAFPIVGIE